MRIALYAILVIIRHRYTCVHKNFPQMFSFIYFVLLRFEIDSVVTQASLKPMVLLPLSDSTVLE